MQARWEAAGVVLRLHTRHYLPSVVVTATLTHSGTCLYSRVAKTWTGQSRIGSPETAVPVLACV